MLVLLAPLWLVRGKAHLKSRLARYADFDVSSLPENPSFLNWLANQVVANRDIYLVSASHQTLVTAVADEFGIFKEAIGSTPELNLRGRKKAEYLIGRFGRGGFDYAGNDYSDLPVWEGCRTKIAVNVPARLLRILPEAQRIVIREERPSIGRSFLEAMRPHQWVKNFLIFLPLLTAHVWANVDAWVSACFAFASFSLCASAVYMLNDLFDLKSDRLHITKRNRPFASGTLPLSYGFIGPPIMLAFSVVIMVLADYTQGLPILAVYFVLTCLYSIWLKQVIGVDIVILAGLYTIRLILGGVVVGVEISEWLLAFSIFFFLSLALVKRFSELFNLKEQFGLIKAVGRGYRTEDRSLIAMLGASSAYLSVLVLVLYVNSEHVAGLYRHPKWILLVCPILLAWFTRLWLVTHRGEMNEDPISFAIKDGFSYGTLVLMGIVVFLAVPL